MKHWRIVGFRHPDQEHSLIYEQNVSDEGLCFVLKRGIEKGCNLFSIRGFDIEKEAEKGL